MLTKCRTSVQSPSPFQQPTYISIHAKLSSYISSCQLPTVLLLLGAIKQKQHTNTHTHKAENIFTHVTDADCVCHVAEIKLQPIPQTWSGCRSIAMQLTKRAGKVANAHTEIPQKQWQQRRSQRHSKAEPKTVLHTETKAPRWSLTVVNYWCFFFAVPQN